MGGRIRRHPVAASLLAAVLVLAGAWAVKLALIARSVGVNADHWAAPQGQAGGLLYVALGDSAAQGIGASTPDRGYVGLLADRLRRSTGGPVEVVNLSKSGARISDVLDTQLPALTALRRSPDVLTVAIGGNDIRAYDRATFAAETERLTAALPPGTYVADAPYFMHGNWERDATQAAGLLRQEAAARGLRPVALHDALESQGWTAMLTQFAADWFHPNDRGHRVWADAFWREIEPGLRR
ncbi:MAG: esterase [Frankiales bacterium]|nr:esterase [Frankiales bacterium]